MKSIKKAVFTIALVVLGLNFAKAQTSTYNTLEWDVVRVGYAFPQKNSQYDAGLTFGSELRYNLKDNFSLGFGLNYLVAGNKNNTEDMGLNGSFSFVGDYYFSKQSAFRGFIGMGAGYKLEGDYSVKNEGDVIEKDGASGGIITPRIGYELGHLRLMASYDLGIKKELTDFISVSVALTLGGGRK